MAETLDFLLGNYIEKNPERYVDYIPTGFDVLDKALGGGFPNELITLGATPSAGKTTLANQIADNIAKTGRNVLFVEVETSGKDLMDKFVVRRIFTQSNKKCIMNGSQLHNKNFIEPLTPELFAYQADCARQAAYELKTFSYIDKKSKGCGKRGWTVSAIRNEIQTNYINKGLQAPVLFVDYLQFIPSDDSMKSEYDAIREKVDGLKSISEDFNIPVILISAINRDFYNVPITTNAFKGNGIIEYSSDIMIALQYYGVGKSGFDYLKARSAFPRKMELQVLKARHGDNSASVVLDYYSACDYFETAKSTPTADNKGTQEKQPARNSKLAGKSSKAEVITKKQGNPPAEDKTSEPEAVELSKELVTNPRFTEAEIMDFFY